MFKQQILESIVFQVFQHHFNAQSTFKQSQFIKLETEIEMIDMSIKQIEEQQSELFQRCLKNWICSDKYFKIIKCIDNIQHNKQQLLQLCQSLGVFIILQTENQVHYLYQNKLGQLIDKIEQVFLNPTQITYIIKFSQLQNQNSQKNIFLEMIRIFNCIYPYLTLTFKYIPQKHLNYLIDCSSQSYEYGEAILKIIDVFDIILWKQMDLLELILSLLPESEGLMYRSPQEFFDSPENQSLVFEQYFNGQCIQIIKGQFQFYCINNDEFKNFLVLSKTRHSMPHYKDQMKLAEIINTYCKVKQNLLVLIITDQNDINFEEFEQICQQNPKLFNTQQFNVESKQNAYLIDKVAMLYLSMQNDLSDTFANLDEQKQVYIFNQFKQELFKKYVLDQL